MLGAEGQGEKLDRLQAPGEVTELSREIGRGIAGDRAASSGAPRKMSARAKAVGRVAPRAGSVRARMRRRRWSSAAGSKVIASARPSSSRSSRRRSGRWRLVERTRSKEIAASRSPLATASAAARATVHHPVLAARRHDEQMCRDLLLRGVEPDEELAARSWYSSRSAGCEVVVDGRPNQRVDEAERRVGAQDLRVHELARGGGERPSVELRERGRDGELGTLAEHGDCSRCLLGVGRKPRQPEHHRSRGGPRAEFGDDMDVGSVGRDTIGGERLEKLVEQKRVPVGRGVAGVGEGGVDLLAQAVTHDLSHRHSRERPGHEHLRVRLAGQLLQGGLIGLRLRRPQAAHEPTGRSSSRRAR